MWRWLKRLLSYPGGERYADLARSPDLAHLLEKPASNTSSGDAFTASDTPGSPNRKILFFDTETTGFHSTDRIVSFAGILLDPAGLADGKFHMNCCHFVFDPGKKSHPRAEEVHGFDDWFLRHQEPFSARIEAISKMFSEAELAVAHNAQFDAGFIAREFSNCRREPPKTPLFCTMQTWRERVGGRSGLGPVCATLGLERCGKFHGAMEDAYLAMMVYLSLHGSFPTFPFEQMGRLASPTNIQDVPLRPDGPLPRRRRKKLSA